MPSSRKGRDLEKWNTNQPAARPGKLRIIGGRFRGRQLAYSGEERTRPMKDNIREAMFNLVGGWIPGKHVIDLFAGTGAIGLESISRGAAHAVMIERHFPTARIIEQNVEALDVGDCTSIVTSDTFFWVRKFLGESSNRPEIPWAIFCSPPYEFYESRKTEMLELIRTLLQHCPPQSIIAVETDAHFNSRELPDPDAWIIRQYAPAQICIFRERLEPLDENQPTGGPPQVN